MLARPHGFCNLADREIAARKLSPLGSWKCPDLAQAGFVDFHLIPFRPDGNLFPQRKMPQVEQSSPLGVVACILKIGRAYNFTQAFLILAEFRRVEVAFKDRKSTRLNSSH